MLGVKIMEKVFCLETISSANWWLLSLLRRGMATPICTKLQTTQMNFLENRLMSVWHTLFFRKYHTHTDRERGGCLENQWVFIGINTRGTVEQSWSKAAAFWENPPQHERGLPKFQPWSSLHRELAGWISLEPCWLQSPLQLPYSLCKAGEGPLRSFQIFIFLDLQSCVYLLSLQCLPLPPRGKGSTPRNRSSNLGV